MDFRFDPKETALLVIDMQNAFCHADGTLALSGVDITLCKDAVPRVAELIRFAQKHGIPDIWTIQEHFADDKTRALHRIKPHTTKRARIASQRGTWDAEIVDELKPLITADSHLIQKHRFSAFYGTRLEVLLRMLGVKTLIITGTTTNACVDTTIREAYMREYDMVIVEDAIGGVDLDLHRAATKVWSFYMGLVVKAAEVPQLVQGEAV